MEPTNACNVLDLKSSMNKAWIWGGGALIAVCIYFALFPVGIFYVPVELGWHVDGGKLVVSFPVKERGTFKYREMTIAEGPESPFGIFNQGYGNKGKVTIVSGSRKWQQAVNDVPGIFWSNDYRCVFFTNRSRTKGNFTTDLYRWKPGEGFSRLTTFPDVYDDLHLAADGAHLCLVSRPEYNSKVAPRNIAFYNLSTKAKKSFKIDNTSNQIVMLDPTQFLAIGSSSFTWNASEKVKTPVAWEGEFRYPVARDGVIWMFRYRNGRWDIVSLNEDWTKIDREIAFPVEAEASPPSQWGF
jgi:hypothetical protein